MITHENKAIENAISAVYQLTEDERIRQECERREDYMNRVAAEKRRFERMGRQIKEQGKKIQEQEEQLQEKNEQIAQLKKQLEEMQSK